MLEQSLRLDFSALETSCQCLSLVMSWWVEPKEPLLEQPCRLHFYERLDDKYVFSFQASFALGIVLFALVGFMIQDWRSLTLTISFIGFPFISFHWLLPESPRWLLAQDRQSEAIEVLLNL